MKGFLAFVGVVALIAVGYLLCKYGLIGRAIDYLEGVEFFR